MSSRYKNLLSPLKVGNRILKNRMISTPSGPHFYRGPEPFPTEALFAYYEGKARNGAAMMTVNGASMFYKHDNGHNTDFDVRDGHNRHYIAQLVDGIHLYSSLATVNMHLELPKGYDVSGGVPNQWLSPHSIEWGTRSDLKTAPAEMIEEYAEEYTDLIAILKQECGFDGAFMHMAYRMMPLGRFLSPLTNKRTDKYGGSLENMFRYPKLLADLMKKKCGSDFLVEATISGCDPADQAGGLTTEDVAEYVKMAHGSFDILQVKAPVLDPAHPIQFHEKTPWLGLAEEIKRKSGGVVPIMTVGGFTTPDLAEDALEGGKVDLVGMARAWISNPEWGSILYEDRPDDLVPCLRCNKCHRSSDADPFLTVCSVNPAWGIEHKLNRIVRKPLKKKKLGVVGGGPAGMKTAILLAQRGHDVTLYEKESVLGGQLEVTRDVSFKWTIQDFKKYLIHQVKKNSVKVKLGTAATREMLAREGFEEIFIAVGAKPCIPQIPGVDGENVMTSIDAYSRYGELADDVVIIGGGEVGVETGIFLARMGKKVTVLEMRRLLAMDSTPIHFYSMLRDEWEKYTNFTGITEARVVAISKDSVTYSGKDGREQKISCGSVILSTGMQSNSREALDMFVYGVRCHLVGDCNKVGNIQKVMRNAFGVTSAI